MMSRRLSWRGAFALEAIAGSGRSGRWSCLFERLQVCRERLQLVVRNDPAPVRHADDRRAADHASCANHVDDLRISVELLAECDAREARNLQVRRLWVRDTAEAVRTVAVDAAVGHVECGALDGETLPGRNRWRFRGRD